MKYDAKALFRLLPDLYEIEDGTDGPLRALLTILAQQAEIVDENIGQLYDDQFIETCSEWAVPYIGDLLGVRGLHKIEGAPFSQRGWVANSIAYRRRKGTLPMLRQLAQDVTSYKAAVLEMFQILEWSQNLNHVRLGHPRTPDLRDTNSLELIGTAFEKTSHTADIRSIALSRGKYNIPNIGMFLWRLRHYPLEWVTAKAGPTSAKGGFTFSPLGLNAPLFNSPEPDKSKQLTEPATEANTPDALRRRAVYDDLEALRQAQVLGKTHHSPFFDTPPPIFSIRVGDDFVPTEEIFICNLETWGKVPTARSYPDATGAIQTKPIRVGVDPVAGRLRFVAGQEPKKKVRVSFSYGFSSDIAGGPYDRKKSLNEILPEAPNWYRVVQQTAAGAAPNVVATLEQAVSDWKAEGAGKHGVIAVVDSDTYAPAGDLLIEIPESSQLTILGTAWGTPPLTSDLRDFTQISPSGVRPHVKGNIQVTGTAADASQSPGTLCISGLLVEGAITIKPGNLGKFQLVDNTLVPATNSLQVQTAAAATNQKLQLIVQRCIVGDLQCAGAVATIRLDDSIVQGSIKAAACPLSLDRCTVTGIVNPKTIEASDCIFIGVITAARTQAGCIRYSFFPTKSKVPRAFRCQPNLAVSEAKTEPAAQILARMTPSFTTTVYGQPGYMQLSSTCSPEILIGASNGDEMGAFNRELHSLREANLRFALTEYLRVGLSAGIFYSN